MAAAATTAAVPPPSPPSLDPRYHLPEKLLRSPWPGRFTSAYAAVTQHEPVVTTIHRSFKGCVDYVWLSQPPPAAEGGGQAGDGACCWPRAEVVLEMPTRHRQVALRGGELPYPAWASDHLSLVVSFVWGGGGSGD